MYEKINNRMVDDDAVESMQPELDNVSTEPNIMGAIEEHVNTLPPEEQEFLAAHMTPEFARALGVATGSQEVFDFFNARADNSIALVPVPREKAQEFVAQMSGGAPSASPAPAPTPPPSGAMGAM